MSAFPRFIGAFVVSLACLQASASENLVVNPFFDNVDQLDGWTISISPAQWDSADEQGLGDSGSARLTHDVDGNNGVRRIIRQCIRLQPNQAYFFGASILLPTGQASGAGHGSVIAQTFPTSDCTGSPDSHFTPPLTEAGVWQFAQALLMTDFATASIRVNLSIQKFSGFTEDLDVLFDNVFLFSDQLFGDGFEPTAGRSRRLPSDR